MPKHPDLSQWLARELPLVAILRGVRPAEVEALGDVLLAAGFRIIEVPMNSPQPLDSIERLVRHLGEDVLVGAGTVTSPDEVTSLAQSGGRLAVSPHCDPQVIAAAQENGLAAMPGVFSASEMFAAIRAGAHALKVFPAEAAPPSVIRALTTVLPASCGLLPVGGITPDTMAGYLDSGCAGFGLGGALYKSGFSPAQIQETAQSFAAAYKRWRDAHEEISA